MSFVVATPEMLLAAASDLASIGSALGAANAAAAVPTGALLAAAGDEVSVAIAALFGSHAQQYQAVGAQTAAFYDRFVQTLTSAGRMFGSAEATNVSTLQPLGGLQSLAAAGSQSLLVEPVQQLGQAWLGSPLAAVVDPVINAPFVALTGRGLIGNGAAGTAGINGGAGGNGGWLFGNGGPGAAAAAASAPAPAGMRG
ncbi:PE family protein [Mycobacterium szulgai]|uniref:PE family protein n=1 Tax=Mycobacterium szulgai TaxID=1787 RepID=UPI0027E2325C|nr:PE family protein [Mycobacterium szulgai]MCV7075077.1 PE family protein [Mycobacterium szulgai]